MNKSSIFLKILTLISLNLGFVACEGSKVQKDHIELDPEVEAQVKEINMERYAGSWLLSTVKSSLYMELSEDGYYVMREDKKSGLPVQLDFGSMEHFKPGLMILHSDRAECQEDGIVYLKMDQKDGAVRLRSTDDRSFAVPLVAVEPRDRLRVSDIACMD